METDLLAPLLLLLFDTNLYLQPQPGGGGRGGGGVQQWNAALQGCCMESDVTETAHFYLREKLNFILIVNLDIQTTFTGR